MTLPDPPHLVLHHGGRGARNRMPAHDLEAEAAILSACMINNDQPAEVFAALDALRPMHFYAERHRRIYEAILAVHAAGQGVDNVSVGSWLKSSGRIEQVGGMGYVTEVLNAAPAVGPKRVAGYARTIIELSARRELAGVLGGLAAESEAGTRPAGELFADARKRLDGLQLTVVPALDPIDVLDVDSIFAPMPPVPYVLGALDLCPGRPAMFVAPGFSGKTIGAQSLGISVAAGMPAWGEFPVKQGRVVHFDYEQGLRLSSERYQRIARASGITKEQLRGQLGLAIYPSITLDDPRAEDLFARKLEGATLGIFDSFRASTPGLDENSSEAAEPLYALGRISERTGATLVVIHHSRKRTKDDTSDARAMVRGSSAIYAASGSVLSFDGGTAGAPVLVSHTRAPTSGVCARDFALAIEDVAIGGDPRGGLRVRFMSEDELTASAEPMSSPLERVKADIVRLLGQEHDIRSKREIERRVTGRATLVREGVAELLERAIMVEHGGRFRLASDVS